MPRMPLLDMLDCTEAGGVMPRDGLLALLRRWGTDAFYSGGKWESGGDQTEWRYTPPTVREVVPFAGTMSEGRSNVLKTGLDPHKAILAGLISQGLPTWLACLASEVQLLTTSAWAILCADRTMFPSFLSTEDFDSYPRGMKLGPASRAIFTGLPPTAFDHLARCVMVPELAGAPEFMRSIRPYRVVNPSPDPMFPEAPDEVHGEIEARFAAHEDAAKHSKRSHRIPSLRLWEGVWGCVTDDLFAVAWWELWWAVCEDVRLYRCQSCGKMFLRQGRKVRYCGHCRTGEERARRSRSTPAGQQSALYRKRLERFKAANNGRAPNPEEEERLRAAPRAYRRPTPPT